MKGWVRVGGGNKGGGRGGGERENKQLGRGFYYIGREVEQLALAGESRDRRASSVSFIGGRGVPSLVFVPAEVVEGITGPKGGRGASSCKRLYN